MRVERPGRTRVLLACCDVLVAVLVGVVALSFRPPTVEQSAFSFSQSGQVSHHYKTSPDGVAWDFRLHTTHLLKSLVDLLPDLVVSICNVHFWGYAEIRLRCLGKVT